jgi:hypothetical protein
MSFSVRPALMPASACSQISSRNFADSHHTRITASALEWPTSSKVRTSVSQGLANASGTNYWRPMAWKQHLRAWYHPIRYGMTRTRVGSRHAHPPNASIARNACAHSTGYLWTFCGFPQFGVAQINMSPVQSTWKWAPIHRHPRGNTHTHTHTHEMITHLAMR